MLKQIVNARKINYKDTIDYVTEIRSLESRSMILKEAIFRKDLKKQIEINKSNQRLAIRLFG
jgi:hypothetical protein